MHVTDPEESRSEERDRAAKAEEPEWVRRRRLAEIFGDVLPEVTRDERSSDEAGTSGSGREEDSPQDRWLRSQVPPHHG